MGLNLRLLTRTSRIGGTGARPPASNLVTLFDRSQLFWLSVTRKSAHRISNGIVHDRSFHRHLHTNYIIPTSTANFFRRKRRFPYFTTDLPCSAIVERVFTVGVGRRATDLVTISVPVIKDFID